jgi:xanthine dehydrogenase accessory factor
LREKPIIIRGGGDIASGVALRLHRCGFHVLICELAQPLTIRRSVSFSEAIYQGVTYVEELQGKKVEDISQIKQTINEEKIPVVIDPSATIISLIKPSIVIDARLMKIKHERDIERQVFLVGLGPGFIAGKNCDVVIETNRGHQMGRVIWQGSAQPDTGVPGLVKGYSKERVIHAPFSGQFRAIRALGEVVRAGDPILSIDGSIISAPFDGLVRGMLHNDLWVEKGTKLADIDPSTDQTLIRTVSDKALAVGGGVLEAILSWKFTKLKHD